MRRIEFYALEQLKKEFSDLAQLFAQRADDAEGTAQKALEDPQSAERDAERYRGMWQAYQDASAHVERLLDYVEVDQPRG